MCIVSEFKLIDELCWKSLNIYMTMSFLKKCKSYSTLIVILCKSDRHTYVTHG